VLLAQPPANWDRVKQLAAGQEIRVSLNDGRKIRGAFQSATGDGLSIAAGKSPETLGRAMVTRVSAKGKNHRLRNVLIGFGAGAAGGLIVGAVRDSQCSNTAFSCFPGKNLGKEGLTPLGALIGAIVGVVLPTGRFHDVYRAK
jgi:hypothetical protein